MDKDKDEAVRLYCKDHYNHTDAVYPDGVDVICTGSNYCVYTDGDTNCTKQCTYNYEGYYKGMYCKEHMLIVNNNTLDGTFSYKNYKCKYVDNNGKKCKIQPSYNIDGEKQGIYCKKHGIPLGMVYVIGRKCLGKDGINCTKQPNFGKVDDEFPTYCFTHKSEDMINIMSKKCEFNGCPGRARYGYKGESPLYCIIHKDDHVSDREEPIINLIDKTCLIEGCDTYPKYNYIGSNTALYCSKHAATFPDKNGLPMINIKNKICCENGCYQQCSFAEKIGDTPKYCSIHADSNMINVKIKKCSTDECDYEALFGYIYEKKIKCIHCAKKENKKIAKINAKIKKDQKYRYLLTGNLKPKCEQSGCILYATYTDSQQKIPTFCYQHKKRGQKIVNYIACKNCHEQPVFGHDTCKICRSKDKYKKNRELRIKEFLEGENINILSHNKVLDISCVKRRPDFITFYNNKYIIIEVDEHQHKYYKCTCEQSRMYEIHQMCNGYPVIFIRFNPDKYINSKGKKIVAYRGREAKLKKLFLKLIETEHTRGLYAHYMFYDGCDGLFEEHALYAI